MNRRKMIGTAATMLAGLASVTHAQEQGADVGSMADRFAGALSRHDLNAFADLFADDYRNHQMSAASPPLAAGKSAKQATVDVFGARLVGMPDLVVTVEAVVASPDKVAASFVYSGTHEGVYMGVAPSGRKLRFTSCDIFSVREGKIAEHWGMGDIAGVLAQLKGQS